MTASLGSLLCSSYSTGRVDVPLNSRAVNSTLGPTCRLPSINRESLVPCCRAPWDGKMTTGRTKSIFTVQCVIRRYSYSPDLICTPIDDNHLHKCNISAALQLRNVFLILGLLPLFNKTLKFRRFIACSLLLDTMSFCRKKLLSLYHFC